MVEAAKELLHDTSSLTLLDIALRCGCRRPILVLDDR
jgi:hypothetical protein